MVEQPRIVFPHQGTPFRPDEVGGKAAALEKLTHHDFRVPPFFVITTQAYFDHLKRPGVDQALTRWQTANAEESRMQAASDLARLLVSEPLSPDLSSCLPEAISRLDAGRPLAVRSSATVEDLQEHSFAGIFASELGVVGAEQVEAAIREVWASLWKPSALSYFRRTGIEPLKVGMAVIVQELIEARAAGVAFGGSSGTRTVRIESIRGLGRPLVEGEVVPDRFVVDVGRRQVRERQTGREPKKLVVNPRGGVRWVKVHDAAAAEASIEDAAVVRVAEWAVAVENALGFAADIEWVVDEAGEIFLVQARPITARLQRARPARIWTGYFFLERFPTPVTPLGWDLLRGPVERRAFRDPLRLLGHRHLAEAELTRLFWGRPYTDLRVFRALYGWVPRRFLSQDKVDLLDDDDRYRLGLLGLVMFAFRCLGFDGNWFWPLHLWLWKRFVPRYTRAVAELQAQPLSDLSWNALFVKLQRAVDLSDDYLRLHRWSLTYADLFFQMVRWSARRWLGWSAVQAAELMMEPAGDRTAEINLELAEIARQAKRHRKVWSRLKKGERIDHPLSQRLEEFFRRYGHRSNSLDPGVPNWRDDPNYVYQIIDGLLRQSDGEASIEGRRHAIDLQADLKARFLHGLPWLLRPLGAGLLRVARTFVLLRENQRFYWQMSIAQLRRICVEIGRRLVEKGLMETPEDVFDLHLEELQAAFHSPTTDLRKVIADRQRKRRQDARIRPAQRLLEFEQGRIETAAPAHAGERLCGLAISPGRSCGPARLVSDPRALHRVRRGDVLVSRSLDPGWTPVLGIVSGVVLEVGGMLSHGSILAREFGVPGVSNIPGLLDRISDGQAVYVDGDRGEVIVDREEET